ncbi:MAG: thiamine pyrophosphate-binding protein [Candidatus Helarchaeota archaeon]|nr:thiamine pyrophosphate-binding protein [Candidatus Helarchaeota archaeon]
MVTIKGNRAIVDALVKNETKYIFGICGTSVAGFLSALSTEESIEYIITRHERGAGSMADGYARASGTVGVCQMHSGAGTLNGMLSIVDAYRDSSPVVLLAGQVSRKLIGREIFGEAKQFAVLEPYTKSRARIECVEDIPKIINNAFYIARSGRPGPVLVEMPEDIYLQGGEVNPYAVDVETQPLSLSIIQDTIDRLLNAERSVILAGGGVLWANATEELRSFAEMLQMPVTTTQNGRGSFPEDHPLSLGLSGWYGGNSVADEALEKSDIIFGIGCTFSSLTTYNFTAPLKGEIIHVNIDPSALGRNARCDYGIVGDAREVLLEIIKTLDTKGVSRKTSTWLEKISRKKNKWNKILWGADTKSESVPVKPQRLIRDVREIIPKSSIVVAGAGLHHLFITNFMQTIYPRTFISSINLGSMGFAFPAAIGAKAAKPEEPVVCLIGDGDFMMSIQDLDTAVRYGFNVVTIIMNNNSYGAPKAFQKLTFGTDFGSDYQTPDLAKIAEDFGARGWTVEKPAEIIDALESALDCGKPAIIDVTIDPSSIPPLNVNASLRLRQSSA